MTDLEQLRRAIEQVAAGGTVLDPKMVEEMLRSRADPLARLTPREMQVLRLVARGMNNRDIARELFISENTVKNHVRNMLEKLQLHSRMEAVVYAVREKLIEIT